MQKNIIEYLREKNDSLYHLKFYGPNDMASSYNIKSLLNDKKEIENYVNDMKYEIKSIDGYINYLFFYTQTKYRDLANQIKPEFIDNFYEVLNYIDIIFSKFEIANVLNYIVTKNIEIQCYEDKEGIHIKRDISELTFEIILKYKTTALKNCGYLEFIIDKYIFFAFEHIKDFKKLKLSYFNKILSTENMNILMYSLNDEVIEFIIRILFDGNYNELAQQKVNDIYNYGINLINDTSHHIYERYIIYKKLSKFLERIGDRRLLQLNTLGTHLEAEQTEELEKNGQKFDYTISSKTYRDGVFSKETLPDSFKLACMTHHTKKVRKKYTTKSNLEEIHKNFKDALTDSFSTSVQKDDYYTNSRIVEYQFFTQQGAVNLLSWLDKEHIQAFAQSLFNLLAAIYDKTNHRFDVKELESDIRYISLGIADYEQFKTNEMAEHYYSFMFSSYICMLIEKVLRNVYLSKNPLEPINLNHVNLGELLKNESTMNSVLGEHTRKYLVYFLSMNDRSIGNNLRNKIMHYNNIHINEFKAMDTYQNLFIFVLMCNSLFVNIVDFEYPNNK